MLRSQALGKLCCHVHTRAPTQHKHRRAFCTWKHFWLAGKFYNAGEEQGFKIVTTRDLPRRVLLGVLLQDATHPEMWKEYALIPANGRGWTVVFVVVVGLRGNATCD
jgi:hypothetical protein